MAPNRFSLAFLLEDRVVRILALAFALAFFAIAFVYGGIQIAGAHDGIQPNTIPVGSDFLALWSAGHLAAQGTPALAYTDSALFSAHKVAIPAVDKICYWFYPPIYQLLGLPFGALPYFVALPLYLLLTIGLYLGVLWKLRPKWDTLLMAGAFQGTWLCLLSGQNGFLSAALMGIGILLFHAHPARAGVVWSVLAYKPQLGLALPVALLTQRKAGFRSLFAGAVAGGALVLFSLIVLGPETWQAFLATAARPLDFLKTGALPLDHMISTYAALRHVGVPHDWALGGQAVVALPALEILARVWRNPTASPARKGAGLIWGTLLTTPHLFQYELPMMGLGLILLWREAERTGWRKGEMAFLFLAWLSPPFLPFAGFPALLLLLLVHTLRRTEEPHQATVPPTVSPSIRSVG